MGTRLTSDALAEAATHFEEAVEADPEWAQARIGLANVYAFQALLGYRRPREIWPVVKLQADAALQLDELSADAHICLGMAYALFDWRWQDADEAFPQGRGPGHVFRSRSSVARTGVPDSGRKMSEACAGIATAQQLAPSPFMEDAQLLSLYFSNNMTSFCCSPSVRSRRGSNGCGAAR